MSEITPSSRCPFQRGPNRGRRICDLPYSALAWMVRTYLDGDLHAYALAAQTEIANRQGQASEDRPAESLEAQADEILRRAGAGHLVPQRRKFT